MLRFARFAVTMLLVVWAAEPNTPSKAFDVSAYYDPVSSIKIHSWNGGFNWGDCDNLNGETLLEKTVLLGKASAVNDSILRMYEEMGLTILNVFMEDTSAFIQQAADHNLQIMNEWLYSPRFRYAEGQDRIMFVADPLDEFILLDDSLSTLGASFNRIQNVEVNDSITSAILSWPSMANPDTVINPAHHIGHWMGWAKKAQYAPAESLWMPLKIKIKGRLDTTYTGEDTLGYLTFFGRFWNMDSAATANSAAWVKFRPCTLWASSYVDSLDGFFVEDTMWIHPTTYAYYTEDVVYVNATTQTTFPDDSITTRTWTEGPYVHWGAHFDVGFEYRPMLISTGNVPFSLYSIEVMNEAYHQLFDAGDYLDEYEDAIAGYFETPHLKKNGGNQVSWYWDEYDGEDIPSMVRLSHILNERHGVGLIINGGGFNKHGLGERHYFYEELERNNARVDVFMREFYPIYGDSTCEPNHDDPRLFGRVYTRLDSDEPFQTIEEVTGCPDYPERGTFGGLDYDFHSYSGTLSLQCALDRDLWGFEPFMEKYNLPIVSDTILDAGFIEQVKLVHLRGTKFWALLMSGWEGTQNWDHNRWDKVWHYHREITPYELKLTTWLAVASDCDGVMYYPGMSNSYHIEPEEIDSNVAWRGLFDWALDDFCDENQGVVVNQARYVAAKKVCNEIHEIAPTLEALDFVKTYASRAFEESYGATATHVSTFFDTLGEGHQEPEDDGLLLVSNIQSWAPDGVGWEETPEYSNSYVQVSRFKSPGSATDDNWFLIVNRRALADERRKIRIVVDIDSAYVNSDYLVDRILVDSTSVAPVVWYHDAMLCRAVDVILEPGEAELVHMSRLDTSDLVLTFDTTLQAPAYYNRNIILDGANVTIKPDTALQRYQIIKGNQTIDKWKDSLEILFAPGKGIKLIEPDSGSNKLTILGNDTTQIIIKCAKGGDYRWAGITVPANGSGGAVTLKYTTITRADYGLKSTSPSQVDSLVGCIFIDNIVGVYSTGRREVRFSDCSFEKNYYGIVGFNGSVIRGWDSNVQSSTRHGVMVSNGCTVDLEEVNVEGGNYERKHSGLRTFLSDTWLKCCKIVGNGGFGFEAIGGSAILADVDTTNTEARFGGNWFADNRFTELQLDGPMFVWADEGQNVFYDEKHIQVDSVGIWLGFDEINFAPWQNNYWRGDTTQALIQNHVASLSSDPMVYPVFTPALADTPDFCPYVGSQPEDNPCINSGLIEELSEDYLSAESSYQNALASTASSCPKVPAITRLLTVNYLGGTSATTTLNYLDAVLDTAMDTETRHALKLGIALTLAEGLSNTDSAKIIYQQVIDSAGSDIYRRIDGQAGHLLVDMREEEEDTVDGLTVEELGEFLDSLDQILG